MKNTPGPWIVFFADRDGPNDVLPAGRPGHIALNIQSEADARLIAAAPDLLAAIVNSNDAHWTMAMRAAVAKATHTTDS